MATPATLRDDGGRFASGTAGGPGRPRGFREELVRAADEAIAPEHVTAIMRRAVRMALEGNLSAMRFVIERACGKTADATAHGLALGITMPNLRTVANCTAAIDRLVEAMCKGDVDRDGAKVLIDVISLRLKAIEVNGLETRLDELEKQAATVDFGRR